MIELKDITNIKCVHCGEMLTDAEQKWYNENVGTCCSGADCCCRGMPEDPPECDKCVSLREVEVEG